MEDKKNKNEVSEEKKIDNIIDVNEENYSKSKDNNNDSKVNSYYNQNNQAQYPKKKLNTLSLIGFVSSLIFFVPFITDIAGLVFSILGLKEISRKDEGGKGFAIAGIIISSIRIAFIFLIIAISIYIIAENGFYNDDFNHGFDYHYYD